MSENEIDSLEIVVEAEANRANRALSGLEKESIKLLRHWKNSW
ncbi:hypothetical protein COPCOM_02703 [Coprococcus comes ATCC 27758]|uniref:Uncharacterized protein n=1 Tax=Coprococcus comes ATCC 27758 TaxID=470146 RepID=C0BA71_9FIRM|nr:hypothetical protein COPCOM_02703 [Coprococcus comes ATCC 27758]